MVLIRDPVLLRAAAALPHDDRERAVGALRNQMCVMADAAGGTPDWTTLTVTGPAERSDADDGARFEWTATVVLHGGMRLDGPDDLDGFDDLAEPGAVAGSA